MESSISAEEQALLEAMGKDISSVILEDYGKFMNPERKNIPKNIIVLDEDTFNNFNEVWSPNTGSSYEIDGIYHPQGNIILIKDLTKKSAEIYEGVKNIFPDYPHDEKFVKYSLMSDFITHEMVHSFQNQYKNQTIHEFICQRAFEECGVSYITKNIMDKRLPEHIPTGNENNKSRIKMYDYLYNKYGDIAYYVLFNSIPEDSENYKTFINYKKLIYSEFNLDNLVNMGMLTEENSKLFETLFPDSK